jgi:hypothetical protein
MTSLIFAGAGPTDRLTTIALNRYLALAVMVSETNASINFRYSNLDLALPATYSAQKLLVDLEFNVYLSP